MSLLSLRADLPVSRSLRPLLSPPTPALLPAGQTVYGFLFDGFREAVFLVLTPTGAAVCLIGLLFCGVFRKMESACQACGNQTEKVSSDSGDGI